MDALSSQFLAAFNVIEDWMRHALDAGEEDDFGALVRGLEKRDAAVRRQAPELKRLARLRNLIAHNHSRDRPLAVPTPVSIERAEALANLFHAPPLLLTLATQPVAHCKPTDPLGHCARKMHAAFSPNCRSSTAHGITGC